MKLLEITSHLLHNTKTLAAGSYAKIAVCTVQVKLHILKWQTEQ